MAKKVRKLTTKVGKAKAEGLDMTSASNLSETSAKSKTSSRNVLLLLLIVLLGALLYYGKSLFIAAMVNGKPVSRLAILQNLEKSGGKQALDSIITKELIGQEAKKKNIVVTDADVQKEIDNLDQTVKAQGTTLDAALATQNMTKQDLEQNIRMQKTVEQLLASEITVSDEDIKKYFDQNKETFGKDAKYDELKDTIKKDLEQEKLATSFQTWYKKLQSESNIKYFVSY